MSTDTIEQLAHSTIQHGKVNDRIYLMHLASLDFQNMPEKLVDLALSQGYSKIFAKLPASARPSFDKAGFVLEACIPGFYASENDGLFMSRFFNEQRMQSTTKQRNTEVLVCCRERQKGIGIASKDLPDAYHLRQCTADDVQEMARLYAQVFPTYPFPIDQPQYLLDTMLSHVAYFGIWNAQGRLVALSSAEIDYKSLSAEMTDFATLSDERGKALATVLLKAMEDAMPSYKINMAYTIARAPSFGMNITFAQMGYIFGGQLINNTNIAGGFEDMNVWYKELGI